MIIDEMIIDEMIDFWVDFSINFYKKNKKKSITSMSDIFR
jgi:hypothetical protein